ncbi:hypothetical protein [Nocardia stercoris]|uniref:Uncharacterized protein n=1 Tax=Nocardia stercoris TaxID=2483361 RepID=A0A3M2KT96_9NOCA|nr:hypothetical protein [Nocardia stercoris]RMI27680.1 hypothetical protein EBN03_33220 [Nocardia stercoris]
MAPDPLPRQLGDTAVHVSSDPDSIRVYVARLAELPYRRLNLDDESIEVTDAVITDRRTGQRPRRQLVAVIGKCTSIQECRATTKLDHLSVTGEQPPAVGQWHRWPAHTAQGWVPGPGR